MAQPHNPVPAGDGVPPGWHPDGSGALRWWDGTGWTPYTAVGPVSTVLQDPFAPISTSREGADLRSIGAFLVGLVGGYIVVFFAFTLWFSSSGPHTDAEYEQLGSDSFPLVAILGGVIGVPLGLWLAKLASKRRR